MRLEKQNRRSCIGFLILLALAAALIAWMSLGGITSETPADDVKGDISGPEAAPTPSKPG